MSAADFPSILTDRLEQYRERLGEADVEFTAESIPAPLPPGSTVLLPGVLPAEQADVVCFLSDLRVAQTGLVRLTILDEEHPLQSGGSPWPRGRSRTPSGIAGRRVIEAVRAAGWTIASVDRLTAEEDSSRLWVDLVAVDIAVMVDASGEGDRDQGSEKSDDQEDAEGNDAAALGLGRHDSTLP